MSAQQDYINEAIARGLIAPNQAQQFSKEDYAAEAKARGLKMPEPIQQQQPSFMDKIKSVGRAAGTDIAGAYSQLTNNPSRAGRVAGASALDLIQGGANLLMPTTPDQKTMLEKFSPYPVGQKTDFGQKLGIGAPQSGDTTLSILPFLAAPELSEEAIPALGGRLTTEGSKGLSALRATLAKGTEGALYNEAAGGNGASGFAMGAAIPGSVALYRGAKSIPSRLVRGTATPEELARNAMVAGESQIPIGQITKSPLTNKLYENTLANIPGAGIAEKQKSVVSNLENETTNFVSNLRDEAKISGKDANDELKTALGQAQKEATKVKNNLYNNVDQIAADEGHELNLNSFKQKAQESMNLIKDSPLLQGNAKLRSFFNNIGGYEKGVPKEGAILSEKGTPIEQPRAPSIKEANLIKNELWNQGQKYQSSASAVERGLGAKYKDLSKAIGTDIKESIETTGSLDLKNAFNDATKYYKSTFGNFLDKGLYKYLDESRPADALARQVVGPSKLNDKYSDIEKINNLLPEDKQHILGYAFLQNALGDGGKVDQKKFFELINSLGSRQFKSLFSTQNQSKLSDLLTLRKMSGDALGYMANPKTGFSTLKSFGHLAGAGAAGGLAANYPDSALGAAAGTLVGSRVLGKLMTSPKVRRSLINQMLAQSKGAPIYDPTIGSQVLSRYLARVRPSQQDKDEQNAR